MVASIEKEAGVALGQGLDLRFLPEHWLFANTGMKKGDSIEGLLGWEMAWSSRMDLPGMQVVAESDAMTHGKKWDVMLQRSTMDPKGMFVFNAATIWWANGLSSPPGHKNPSRHGTAQQGPDQRVQQITHNLFQSNAWLGKTRMNRIISSLFFCFH